MKTIEDICIENVEFLKLHNFESDHDCDGESHRVWEIIEDYEYCTDNSLVDSFHIIDMLKKYMRSNCLEFCHELSDNRHQCGREIVVIIVPKPIGRQRYSKDVFGLNENEAWHRCFNDAVVHKL